MSILIIVPIYKGLEETRACINSLIYSHPENKTPSTILLINDASPEKALVEYLESITHPNIELLHNEENLGFVGTVNRGMELRHSADVILLNSDTEVSGNWIDRLYQAAYKKDNIATITPFSNNATICSFPHMAEDNELIFHSHIDTIDHLFSTLPDTLFEIPTAVGYCMYIKDAALTEVGLFDVKTFGKGYGEENDFCQRAILKGWTNQLLGNVFVYHKGQTSFQETRDERVINAIKIINQRYPKYESDVHQFIANDPAKSHRLLALFEFIRQSPLPKILNIYQGTGGGVLRNIHELKDFYNQKALILMLYSPPESDEHFVNVELYSGFSYCFNLNEEYDALIQLLKALNINHIHYHHLMRLSEKIWNLAETLDCLYDVTLHDFYSINGNPTQSHEGRFVGELPKSERDALCALNYPLPNNISVAEWQEKMVQFFNPARYLLTPSVDTAEWLRRDFPTTSFLPAYHPESYSLLSAPKPQRRATADKTLHVVILGAIAVEKGMNVIKAVAEAAASLNAPIRFTIMGYTHRQIKHVATTGAYREADADELLHTLKPDLIWLPSIWPETYSYTLSYAIAHGLPILGFNIGAFRERLQYRQESYLLSLSSSPKEIAYWLVNYQKSSPEVNIDKQLPMALSDFYHHNYLEKIAIKPLPAEKITWDSYYDFLAKDDDSNLKVRLLKGLLRVKRISWMTPMIDVIPISLQKKIKRTLSRRPLNEL